MENISQKTDRRIVKTKRAIHYAMLQLMAKKDINDISVTEISELADINRKTFYNYYSGIYQLIDEIENDIVESFEGLLKTTNIEQALADPSLVFDKLYNVIKQYPEFAAALFNSRHNTSLSDKILLKLINLTRDAAVDQLCTDPAKTEYIIRFIFAGEIAAYQAWYRSDRSVPITELSRTIESLCTKGLDCLLQK